MEWEAICARDQAWNEARTAILEDTCTITDARLLRCLTNFTPDDMTDMCLEKLLEAYGQ